MASDVLRGKRVCGNFPPVSSSLWVLGKDFAFSWVPPWSHCALAIPSPLFTCQCSSFLWRRRWRWKLCGCPMEARCPEHPDKATQHSGLVISISGQTALEARTDHLALGRHVQIKQAPKKSLAPSLFVHCTFSIPIFLISDLLKEAVQNPWEFLLPDSAEGPRLLICLSFQVYFSWSLSVEKGLTC